MYEWIDYIVKAMSVGVTQDEDYGFWYVAPAWKGLVKHLELDLPKGYTYDDVLEAMTLECNRRNQRLSPVDQAARYFCAFVEGVIATNANSDIEDQVGLLKDFMDYRKHRDDIELREDMLAAKEQRTKDKKIKEFTGGRSFSVKK